jgi:hypothetical protein
MIVWPPHSGNDQPDKRIATTNRAATTADKATCARSVSMSSDAFTRSPRSRIFVHDSRIDICVSDPRECLRHALQALWKCIDAQFALPQIVRITIAKRAVVSDVLTYPGTDIAAKSWPSPQPPPSQSFSREPRMFVSEPKPQRQLGTVANADAP